MKKLMLSLFLFALSPLAAYSFSDNLNIKQIERLVGLKGQYSSAQKMFKIAVPRDDLNAAVTNVKLTSQMGLTSWIIFKNTHHTTRVIGDLVLSEEQVSPVLTSVIDHGFNVTSLDNHYLWEGSRIMFMRIEGTGDQNKLAFAVSRILSEIKSSSLHGEFPYSNIDIAKSNISSYPIDTIVGIRGTRMNGVHKVVLSTQIKQEGNAMGAPMGMTSWAAFAGTDHEAVVDGDIALLTSTIPKVIKPLKNAGIYVVGIHQHMTDEGNPFVSLHFWGIGDTTTLARGLRTALNIKTHMETTKQIHENAQGALVNSTVEKFIKPMLTVGPRGEV